MKPWIPVLSISLAAFIFVTSELIPVGLISDIAHGFSRTDAQTGLLMTIYAWVVAIMSLPLTAYSAKFNRRHLMLTLLAIFVGGHILSATAWNFGALTVSRLLVALAHSIFWAIATPLGIRLAPTGQRDRAMVIVATGATLGGVLGVPCGTYLGQAFGWRMSFAVIGLCAAIVGGVLLKTLPSLPSANKSDFKIIGALFRRRNLVLTYLLTVLIMSGHFTAFTFITPYLVNIGRFPKEWVSTVLLVFGCAGVAGGLIAPKFLAKQLPITAIVSLTVVGLSLLSLRLTITTFSATLGLVFVWGVAFLIFNLVLQNLVLKMAPDAEDVAMAGFSGIYNIGIGAGALLGSLSSEHQHLEWIGLIGASLAGVAWLLCLYLMRVLYTAVPAPAARPQGHIHRDD